MRSGYSDTDLVEPEEVLEHAIVICNRLEEVHGLLEFGETKIRFVYMLFIDQNGHFFS